jgi:hypothetical protein
MNLDRGRVQGYSFELNADDLLDLQLLEHTVENASLGPTAHPHVNSVPAAKTLRKSSLLAALLSHIQHCIEHLKVAQPHVPTLHRQCILDPFILRFCQFHR